MDKDRQRGKEYLRGLSFKEKVKHYIYYYKLHITIVIAVAVLLGIYIITRMGETEYAVSVSLFSKGYVTIEAEEKAEQEMSDWLGGDDFKVELNVTTVPEETQENAMQIGAVYTKLDGHLAAGTVQALILDENVCKSVMEGKEYADVILKEYSLLLGTNAKRLLGLYEDKPYYYLVRKIYKSEENDEEALKKHQNAIKIYKKLKEIK